MTITMALYALLQFPSNIGDDDTHDAQVHASGRNAVNDGSAGRTMETIMGKLKPEAAYFTALDGLRGGMIFFDMADPSQIPEVVEPFFLNLNAKSELLPVTNGGDLRKGLAKLGGNSYARPLRSRASN
jgi:hypothetical protein